ncbi:cyclopropane-fatty-acyl-phospholipid synthase [Exophiala viscosa]|uniref:cyclopropane-fatty-acyl-phospholipid synthase n=1 Tax=Exophiala viscosa TaxID=2486360 RepID=UPI00219D1723|nr:cyclopropane-fatty-acyl-phospholipid synthase [Exophiala viscosa]
MAGQIPQSTDPTVRYMSTSQAYDLWASVYDTDGNFLQALDTIEMKSLLPRMLALLETSRLPRPWKLVDLGCGTGRNTAALLGVEGANVVGLDVSPGMLQVARQRLEGIGSQNQLRLEVFDMIEEALPPKCSLNADVVVSTLVLEHVPADIFFGHVSRILKPGGILLLTNMHSEMGSMSQAGFVDPKTGEKIRPTSYSHTVAEVEAAAAKSGLEPVDKIEERAVDQSMIPLLGERSGKWVGVTVWFGGIVRKKP